MEPDAKSLPQLGALRAATIVCDDLDKALDVYRAGLDFELVERGEVSAALAASWGAPGHAGDRFGVLAPREGKKTYLRFVEHLGLEPHRPYATLGWNAIEISVASSHATVDRLTAAGFKVLGPAQDLEFSKGALVAGQVMGPFGEVLYLTQINAQLDNFTLPRAVEGGSCLFIVILGAQTVAATVAVYDGFGGIEKPSFEAAVDFVNAHQDMPLDHEMLVGCIETLPCSYIEVDESPAHIGPRAAAGDGLLPPGVAIVTFAATGDAAAIGGALGPACVHGGVIAGGAPGVVLRGAVGELIECILE